MMSSSPLGRFSVHAGASPLVWSLLLVMSILGRPSDLAAQDAVAGWLESRGLDRLRMSRLEEMLSSTRVEDEQDVLIEQLIELYVRGFDSTLEEEARMLLEERGRRLLEVLGLEHHGHAVRHLDDLAGHET